MMSWIQTCTDEEYDVYVNSEAHQTNIDLGYGDWILAHKGIIAQCPYEEGTKEHWSYAHGYGLNGN